MDEKAIKTFDGALTGPARNGIADVLRVAGSLSECESRVKEPLNKSPPSRNF